MVILILYARSSYACFKSDFGSGSTQQNFVLTSIEEEDPKQMHGRGTSATELVAACPVP